MVCCPFPDHDDDSPSCGVVTTRSHPKYKLGSFNCFAGETRVITSSGTVPMKEIVGKRVKVLTEGGKWVSTTFKQYGRQKLYRIDLSRNGNTKTVYATAEHRWFVDSLDWRRFVGESSDTKTQLLGEKRTIDLEPGVYLKSETPLKEKFTLDRKAIQHGFVCGDGTLDMNGRAIAYFCGDKIEIKKFFREWKKHRYTYHYRDQIGGMPGEWKELPSLSENKEYLAGFLAGFIAADGCVDKSGVVSIDSKDMGVIDRVRDIAIKLGITVMRVREKYRATNYTKGKKTKIVSLMFGRKDFPSKLLLRSKHKERFSSNKKATKDRLSWKVEAVTKTSRVETVYCCVVPKTHSFVLEDYILTGNCLGCGKNGHWNRFAEVIGAETIPEWDTKEKNVSDEILEGIEDKLLGEDEFTVKKILKIMQCEEAQPWPVEFDWRGFKGSLINKVGGLIIQDNYNEDVAVVFPVSIHKRIRGGVKAVMQKRDKQTSYITMRGEWINKYGLFPFDYTLHLIKKRKYNFVVLVEGPRDALRLLRNGIPAMAVLGANTIGKVKAMLIESMDVQVYVITDNDSGGDKLWMNLKEKLGKIKPKRLKLPKEKDAKGKLIKMDPFNAPKYVLDNIKDYLRQNNSWKVI